MRRLLLRLFCGDVAVLSLGLMMSAGGCAPSAPAPAPKTLPPPAHAAPSAQPESPTTTEAQKPEPPAKPRTLTEILDTVDDGVVYITAKDSLRRDVSIGTGFVVDRSGLVATNYHVLESAVTATVQMRNGDKLDIAGVRAWDADHDLAIVQLKNPPETLEAFTLTEPRELVQGEELIAIGHPSGFKYTVTTGIVSAVRPADELPEQYQQALGTDSDTLWVQTSAAVSSGSSGGPLMTSDGAVVAINTWIGSGQNLAFGVHVKHLLALLGRLEETATPLPLPGTGLLVDSEVAGIFDQNQSELMQLMQEARRQTSQQQATKLMLERYPVPRNAERLLDIAGDHRGTNKGLEALHAVCAMTGTHKGKLLRLKLRAVDDLHKDYVEHPRIGDALRQLGQTHAQPVFDLLEAVRVQHADPNIRGLATYTLADSLAADQSGTARFAPEVEQLLTTILADYRDARWGRWKVSVKGLERSLFTFQHLVDGRPAPEIVGMQADGSELKLSSFRGKAVVLDFWADWCPHCRDMYEPTRNLVASLKDQPFAFLGVNVDPPNTIQSLIDDKTVTWQNWIDGPEGPIAKEWHIESYPTTFLLDDQGVIRFRDLRGPILAQMVKSLIAGRAFRLPRDVIAAGSEWKYATPETVTDAAWRSPEFNDSTWQSGPAPLGCKALEIATELPDGARQTVFARRTFDVADLASVRDLVMELWVDDGAQVFLNGTRVKCNNLPESATSQTPALEPALRHGQSADFALIDPALLKAGSNLMAVEIHQPETASVDMKFDLALSANAFPLIQRALEDESEFVREAAVSILTDVGHVPADSIDALQRVVREGTPMVQMLAASALLQSDPAQESKLKVAKTTDAELLELRQVMASSFRNAGWRVVKQSDRPRDDYESAWAAMTASALFEPNLPPAMKALPLVRLGKYQEAMKAAGGFFRFQHHPFELACLCLARCGLEDYEGAGNTLEQLRKELDKPEHLELDGIDELLKECETALANAPADALSVLP
jgi:S1-C subfamily serine protease/thiol-disulfide isomerase/thioredoxin